MASRRDLLRKLPSVDEVLKVPEIKTLAESYPRRLVVDTVRAEIGETRRRIASAALPRRVPSLGGLVASVRRVVAEAYQPSLRSVINATGVVIHTNLGRAILAEKAVAAMVEVARGYSNLEFDIEAGARGSRQAHVSRLLTELTGAEAAMVVNNNASAVLLALTTLCSGREAVVSRGQLVEIGGSFRIPDVMRQSGATLREVGTTNKTYLKDFRSVIGENTGILMRVHPSNFRVVGFAAEVPLDEMVSLAGEFGLPVLDDLGSGVLVDLARYGLSEPTVQESIKAGADVITFSGDKLLGGPQAGLIVGKKRYVDMMHKHPMARAVRADKFTLAALEATLRIYLDEKAALKEIPTLRMLTATRTELRRSAAELASKIKAAVGTSISVATSDEISRAGGGSLPLAELPTVVVALRPQHVTVNELEEKLRLGKPSVLARIKEDRLLLDVRTIQEGEDKQIVNVLKRLT